MSAPVILTATGHVVLPLSLGHAGYERLGSGLQLDWAPTPELGGTLITIAAFGTGRIATVISRAALRETIASLQSIDAQLEEMA